MPLTPSPEWTRLRAEIVRRIREPIGRVIFIVYFFAIVIFLGGMGWIIPLCRFYFGGDKSAIDELPSAFATFFLALIASAMADIVLSGSSSANEENNLLEYKGFKIFAFGASLMGVPLAFAALQSISFGWAYAASVIGLVMSLFLWWVLNADNGKWVDDSPPPTASTGGSTSVALPGSMTGIIT